jgi:hypothetical protein
MTSMGWKRGLVSAATLFLVVALAAGAWAQNMFYREVEKDGRIYVFASGSRYATFEASGGVEMGQSITRLGFGPNGETVVFDSEDAINLYLFKHDKPGEVFEKPKEAPKSPYPSWKISGLVFGDFYDFTDHHDPKFDNQNGFWIRRAYFTYEHTFSEKFYGRLRLEMNGNGQLAGGNMVPFVKDAFLRWTFHGQQQVLVGLQPTPSFDWYEQFWGLRHIEKTPIDLYRIDTARDLALGFAGPIGGKGVRYAAQVGNDSGNGSETDKFKTVRGELRFEKKPGIVAEAFWAFGARAGDQDRTTGQGILGYQGKSFRLAGQFVHQKRDSGNATPDVKIDIWSGFAAWQPVINKTQLFARWDHVKGKLGDRDTGLPGADGIDYLVLSNRAPFNAIIAGFEYYLFPTVRISPNVEYFSYDDSVADVSKDVVARVTFFWSW